MPVAKDLCRADIYLRHKVKLEQEPTCLTGDSKVLLIGFADGTLATAAWSGKVRGKDDCFLHADASTHRTDTLPRNFVLTSPVNLCTC